MRKGLLKCSNKLITEEWKSLYIFFKDFRPIHIELRYWENDIWYFYGISEFFDEIKEGESVPQYTAIFTKQDDGSLTYKFEKT